LPDPDERRRIRCRSAAGKASPAKRRRQRGEPIATSAAALFVEFESGYAIAAYILVCAIISLIATAMLKDYTNKDISREYH
jgi:hypothetical protein